MSRKSWTAFQDALLVDAAHTFQKRWILVQDRVPGRSAKECEERFAILDSLGQSKPFPKSPLKRAIERSKSPKAKQKLRKLVASSPLKGRSIKANLTKKTSPKKKVSPQKFRAIQQKSSPLKRKTNHVEPISFSSKLINRSPTKMNWSITNSNVSNQNKLINSLSSQWNINGNAFYSSPVQKQDRNWPFAKSSPIVQNDVFPSPFYNVQPTNTNEITLDDLLNFSDAPNDSTAVDVTPHETSEFDDFFSFTDNNQSFQDAYQMTQSDTTPMMSSYADPLDPFTSFACPTMMPAQDVMLNNTQSNDLNWDDFFTNTGTVEQTFDPNLLLDPTQSLFFDQFEVDDVDLSVTPMTISKDEVDDLFKDIVQEPQIRNSIAPQANNIEWVTSSTDGFSKDQILMLKSQLSLGFQLIVQGYCFEKELKGSDRTDERPNFWEDQLNQLMRSRDIGMSVYGTNSLFNIPGTERVGKLKSMKYPPNLLFQKAYRPKPKKTSLELTNSMQQAFRNFSDLFDRSLLPVIQLAPSTKLTNFSTYEDELLYLGLVAFGPNDLSSIQGHFLPVKSRMTIKYRIHNSVRRNRAVSKLLQGYHLLPFKPMTVLERFLLKQGILKYGIEFRKLIDLVFPHLPSGLIECVWNDLCRTGQVAIKWTGERISNAYIAPAPMITNVQKIKPVPTLLPRKPKMVTQSDIPFHSSEVDVPTPNNESEPNILVYDEPTNFSSPLRKVSNWNSDFETDVEEPKVLADISLNKSIERPKISFAGFYDLDSDENEEGNENTILTPSPCTSPVLKSIAENPTFTLDRQVAGVGRGGFKKKRTKATKDLIESTNVGKLRRKFPESYRAPRSMDYAELQKTFKVMMVD